MKIKPNALVTSIKRIVDGRRHRSRKTINKERKVQDKKRILVEHLDEFEKSDLVVLKNHASTPVKKEILSLPSKTRSEASRNKFIKKSQMPEKIKTFTEIIVTESSESQA